MVHIKVYTITLVFNAARLIIDVLGEKIGAFRENRIYTNGPGVRNQINTAVFINADLFRIVSATILMESDNVSELKAAIAPDRAATNPIHIKVLN